MTGAPADYAPTGGGGHGCDDARVISIEQAREQWAPAGVYLNTASYGLRLAADARRFDTSPAWFSWVGAQPALELLNRIGVGSVYAHDVALANRFRAGLGMEPSNSAIVSVADAGAAQRLERAGIVAALRGGRMRASWHVYNTEHDVDRALDALSG